MRAAQTPFGMQVKRLEALQGRERVSVRICRFFKVILQSYLTIIMPFQTLEVDYVECRCAKFQKYENLFLKDD